MTKPKAPRDPELPSLFGRPLKFNAARRELLLNALRGGSTLTAACALADIHLDTLLDHRTRDPEFSGQVEKAQQEAVTRMLARVQKAAYEAEVTETLHPVLGTVIRRVTKYDHAAARWWLEHHPLTRAEFGPNAAAVQVNVGVAVAPVTAAPFEPDRRYAAQVVAILQNAGVLPSEADPDAVAPLLLAEAEPVPPAPPEG